MTDALADELERRAEACLVMARAASLGGDANDARRLNAKASAYAHAAELARADAALREREPVAWRWRLTDRAYGLDDGVHGKWRYDEPPSGLRLIEVQPLYTAPTLEHQEEQS